MAVQDVLLGAVVIRHNPAANNLQVDCCLIDDLEEYEQHEAARFVVTFLLCEAYRSGGTMELEFTRDFGRAHAPIPGQIHALARARGVTLAHFGESRITSTEARVLFASVTELPESTLVCLSEMDTAGELSVEQACFAVHHGDWSTAELAWLIGTAVRPGAVLSGANQAEHRLLFARDNDDCCTAILGGRLDRVLSTRPGESLPLEDDPVPLAIDLAADVFAKIYISDDPLELQWAWGPEPVTIPPGTPLLVAVRAWSGARLRRDLARDMEQFANWSDTQHQSDSVRAVLVPSDFESLGESQRGALGAAACGFGAHLLICPEPLNRLQEDALRRFKSGRITRKC